MVKNVGIAVWLKLHQIKPNKFYYTHIKMPIIIQLKRNESAHWELKPKIVILVKWLKLTKAPVHSISLAHALSLCNRECTDPVFWKVLAFAKRRGNACISCTNRTQLSASFSPTLPSFLLSVWLWRILLLQLRPFAMEQAAYKRAESSAKNHSSQVLWKCWKYGSEHTNQMSCELCAGTKPKVQINKIFAWCNYI